MVVATGWSPTFYANTFDMKDLQTVVDVITKQNKKTK